MKRILVNLLPALLFSLISRAQSGADPAVTSRNLLPAPLPGVGSTFTLTFRIGNNGSAPISGLGSTNANRMQFGICLGKCAPNPASTAALSGPLLTYFDVVYNPSSNCFEGRQKQDVTINPTTVFSLSLAAIVTSASANPAINDIGASCNIAPNGSASPQPTDNDFASIYTHTVSTAMPVSLVDFGVKAQDESTVLLNWTTSWERTNKAYLIERSKDLQRFEPVGTVTDVAATSSNLSRYTFVDQRPYRGTSYYRLVQMDMDGSRHAYKAEPVVIDGRYSVYPNPVVGRSFTLELDEPASALLHLYSAAGLAIDLNRSITSETSVRLSAGAELPGGLYLLTVEERGITRTYRLLVQP